MSIRNALLSLSVAVASAGPALAQSFANPSPSAVQTGRYDIEPTHTRVLFSVSHMGFTTWYGDFSGATGSLVLDPAHPDASRLQVSIPMAGLSTTNAKLDGELKGADWFDVARFPTASFRSTSVKVVGQGQADVTGDLTLHGVTRPETLRVSFNGAGQNPLSHAYTAGFEVRGQIKRSDFGVSKYVPVVGDNVDLIVSAAFTKATG